ncbi:unnamed protein product, partial [Staurois parvus]
YPHCHLRPRLSITRLQPVITPRRPVIFNDHQRERGLFCLLIVLLPVSSGTLLWMASSVLTVKNTHTPPPRKHSLHIVNPLIMLTPLCPVPLAQCQCFFFFSTDHCIGVTGDVSDTKSIPPVSECPPQSRYKSL